MENLNTKNRRTALKGLFATIASAFGLGFAAKAGTRSDKSVKEVVGEVVMSDDVPLFSGAVKYGNLLFIAGKGAHVEGDITSHTKIVLDELQKELEKNGSSMNKVLKVNVYLHDLNDYKAMNEAYRGRFGNNPPVRTTVAVFGGVPGNSLVEIDCIAALD